MSRAARIEAYVDATREVATYRQAEKEDGKTPERSRAILEARARQAQALRGLRGGDLALAQRLMRAPTPTTTL